MKARRYGLLLPVFAAMASQAGHLLAYQVRFGAAAQQLQATGAHAYFPAVAKTFVGVLAAAALASVVIVGSARVAGGRDVRRAVAAPSYLPLLAILFTLQLAVFAGQETVESAVAGAPVASVPVLLLWGTLGQLPVAALGALALRWHLTRFEPAVAHVHSFLALGVPQPQLVAALVPCPNPADGATLVPGSATSARRLRGPPSRLRFSSK